MVGTNTFGGPLEGDWRREEESEKSCQVEPLINAGRMPDNKAVYPFDINEYVLAGYLSEKRGQHDTLNIHPGKCGKLLNSESVLFLYKKSPLRDLDLLLQILFQLVQQPGYSFTPLLPVRIVFPGKRKV